MTLLLWKAWPSRKASSRTNDLHTCAPGRAFELVLRATIIHSPLVAQMTGIFPVNSGLFVFRSRHHRPQRPKKWNSAPKRSYNRKTVQTCIKK